MQVDNKYIIKVDMTCKKPLIWSQHDCLYVQENYRILGKFIGPLPRSSNSSKLGLPLMLMKEEAKLLYEKGYAHLVEYPVLKEDPSKEIVEKFQQLDKKVNEKQNRECKQIRLQEIENLAKQILVGKQNKQKELNASGKSIVKPEELTLESVKADLINKLNSREEKELIQLHIQHPFIEEIPVHLIEWHYPKTDKEMLQYSVFKDLWEKGYYISSGIKFGGDFLVYNDNPNDYHASFIIKCVDDNEQLNPKDIVLWARLGTMTKKTLVLCSLNENNVQYHSIQWPGKDLDTYIHTSSIVSSPSAEG